MENNVFLAEDLTLKPIKVSFYMPPIIWKGDPIGHIGENDVFFWVVKGKIVLFIDDNCYLLSEGQLAFLPKGKNRRYTNISKDFVLYTMSFFAEADGINLMQGLGFCENNHVVNIENTDEMTAFFENSSHIEMYKAPINNVIWATNILNIIKSFSLASKKQFSCSDPRLKIAADFMEQNANLPVMIEELAELAHMQPTYFIRRFKDAYGVSPMSYLKNLKIHKALQLLAEENLSIESVSEMLGMEDPSYFSRWFKKSCGISPSEYKKIFEKN